MFLIGRQDVGDGASVYLRKYGGMRNKCFKQACAVSEMYRIQESITYF